ncbi:MAG: hypothetical protein AAB823_01455 [Patescibacteria group bacterium]
MDMEEAQQTIGAAEILVPAAKGAAFRRFWRGIKRVDTNCRRDIKKLICRRKKNR